MAIMHNKVVMKVRHVANFPRIKEKNGNLTSPFLKIALIRNYFHYPFPFISFKSLNITHLLEKIEIHFGK